jgi:predicted ABC-type exoprotein transport system permease subunit
MARWCWGYWCPSSFTSQIGIMPHLFASWALWWCWPYWISQKFEMNDINRAKMLYFLALNLLYCVFTCCNPIIFYSCFGIYTMIFVVGLLFASWALWFQRWKNKTKKMQTWNLIRKATSYTIAVYSWRWGQSYSFTKRNLGFLCMISLTINIGIFFRCNCKFAQSCICHCQWQSESHLSLRLQWHIRDRKYFCNIIITCTI